MFNPVNKNGCNIKQPRTDILGSSLTSNLSGREEDNHHRSDEEARLNQQMHIIRNRIGAFKPFAFLHHKTKIPK
jgi:hypothetical protein